jgi:hypothetical protein
MQTLSKAREQQLIDAVKTAVDMVDNDGVSPNEALEKVARQEKWGQEMIRFASHAYNTGRQTAQREAGKSIMDKFASFELADPDKIIGKVWPKNVKSAADTAMETTVSDDYSRPPAWLNQQQRAARIKVASADLPALSERKAQPLSADPKTAMSRHYARHLDLKRAVEEARYKAGAAYDELLGGMGMLRQYFKQPLRGRLPFATVEKAAAIYYGPKTKPLLDYVYRTNRLREDRADQVKTASTHAIDHEAQPFNLIRYCCELADTVAEKRAAHAEAQETLTKHANDKLAQYAPGPVEPLKAPGSLIPEEAAAPKAANWLGGTMLGAATKGILDPALKDDMPSPDEGVKSDYLELTDPSHENALRKIRAQAMLGELLDDEVIGGYDPQQVMQAYNELSQMAPKASLQPMAMRAMLRRQLQGNVEPFEAKETADLEKTLRQTNQPQNLMPQARNAIL